MARYDVVYKARLSGQITTVEMPTFAEVLHVEVQHDHATLWFRCDPSRPTESRYFRAFATGHPKVPKDAKFLGTCMFDGGHLVYHIFEVFSPAE